MISGSFVTITLGGIHYPREPERARKGPKGPDEASVLLGSNLCCSYFSFLLSIYTNHQFESSVPLIKVFHSTETSLNTNVSLLCKVIFVPNISFLFVQVSLIQALQGLGLINMTETSDKQKEMWICSHCDYIATRSSYLNIT